MGRLRTVGRSETDAPIVHAMYDLMFGKGVDPVADGVGTTTGSPGDWWTTHALSPAVLEHSVQGFVLYRSPDRAIDPTLRELAQARVGWSIGSTFVYSQHVQSMRGMGIDAAKIDDLPNWQTSDAYSRIERAVMAYADAIALDGGRVSDELFAVLTDELTDEAILELTYIAAMYLQHAVVTRALRLEFDDVDEHVQVIDPPEDFRPEDFVAIGRSGG